MSIRSKVFLDSSVLIDAIKGLRTALLQRLAEDAPYECFISQVVISAYLFHFLALTTSVTLLSLKMQKNIPAVLA